MAKDKKEQKAAIKTVDNVIEGTGKATGAVAGGLTGAAGGAVIGTLVCPGVGTAVGAAIGGIATGAAGKAIGGLAGKIVTGTRKGVTAGKNLQFNSNIVYDFVTSVGREIHLLPKKEGDKPKPAVQGQAPAIQQTQHIQNQHIYQTSAPALPPSAPPANMPHRDAPPPPYAPQPGPGTGPPPYAATAPPGHAPVNRMYPSLD